MATSPRNSSLPFAWSKLTKHTLKAELEMSLDRPLLPNSPANHKSGKAANN